MRKNCVESNLCAKFRKIIADKRGNCYLFCKKWYEIGPNGKSHELIVRLHLMFMWTLKLPMDRTIHSLQLITSISLFYLTWIRFAWRNVNSCICFNRVATFRKTRQITRLAKRKTNIQKKTPHTHTKTVERIHIVLWVRMHTKIPHFFSRVPAKLDMIIFTIC